MKRYTAREGLILLHPTENPSVGREVWIKEEEHLEAVAQARAEVWREAIQLYDYDNQTFSSAARRKIHELEEQQARGEERVMSDASSDASTFNELLAQAEAKLDAQAATIKRIVTAWRAQKDPKESMHFRAVMREVEKGLRDE